MKRLIAANILLTSLVLILDQITKRFLLGVDGVLYQLESNWISLRLAVSNNPFFAFSIPAPEVLIALVIGIVFVAVCILWIKQIAAQRVESIMLAIIIGGALGNIFDRIIQGGVIDWIEIDFFSLSTSSFNIADIAIVVGALGWVIVSQQNSFKKSPKA